MALYEVTKIEVVEEHAEVEAETEELAIREARRTHGDTKPLPWGYRGARVFYQAVEREQARP